MMILLLICWTVSESIAQPLNNRQIDSLVELTLKTFNVPGIAVGVVKDGKLIHAKGYGVGNLETGKRWMKIPCSVLLPIPKPSPLPPSACSLMKER